MKENTYFLHLACFLPYSNIYSEKHASTIWLSNVCLSLTNYIIKHAADKKNNGKKWHDKQAFFNIWGSTFSKIVLCEWSKEINIYSNSLLCATFFVWAPGDLVFRWRTWLFRRYFVWFGWRSHVSLKDQLHNLGVLLYPMEKHISTMPRSALFNVCQIAQLKPCLDRKP